MDALRSQQGTRFLAWNPRATRSHTVAKAVVNIGQHGSGGHPWLVCWIAMQYIRQPPLCAETRHHARVVNTCIQMKGNLTRTKANVATLRYISNQFRGLSLIQIWDLSILRVCASCPEPELASSLSIVMRSTEGQPSESSAEEVKLGSDYHFPFVNVHCLRRSFHSNPLVVATWAKAIAGKCRSKTGLTCTRSFR